MKNRIFISLAATALMASFAACSNDTEEGVGASSAVQFSATLVDNATRAEANVQTNTLSQGLEIGLFSSGLTEDASNTKLTVGSDNALTTEAELLWKATGNASFYAYAPYASSLANETTTLDFAVADDQTASEGYIASDLLYGTATDVTNGFKVNLTFNHKLAKVVLKIKNNAELITLTNPKISLLNVDKAVTMTLATGEFTTTSDAKNGEIAVHQFSETVNQNGEITCAAVVAPQTIGTENDFVRIENGEKTYYCKLGSSKELASGKSYTFNVTFEDDLITVEYDGPTLNGWDTDDAENGTDTEKPEENVTYTVGDYLLSDGSFVKSSEASGKSPIGVIFSTTVSTTDASAGYNAYILGLYDLSAKNPFASTQSELPSMFTAVKTLSAYAADLDGLSTTQAVQKESSYATSYPMFDLSTESLPSDLGDSFSQWFIPSAGQFIQILNNLGGANIPSTSDQYYAVVPSITDYEGSYLYWSGKKYLFSKTPASLANVLNAITGSKGIKVTNNGGSDGGRYAVASFQDASNVILMDLQSSQVATKPKLGEDSTASETSVDIDKSNAWLITAGGAAQSRNRVACIAVKSDKIVAPTATEE